METTPPTDILANPEVRALAWKITVERYHQLSESGLVPEKTELIRGVVIDKMTVTPEHSWLVRFLAKALRNALAASLEVRQEQPLTLHDSEPEPDLAVVKDDGSGHRHAHPSHAELVIEVCLTSESIDRQKLAIYAEAGIPECWLVIRGRAVVEVYSQPKAGKYAKSESFGLGTSLKSASLPQLSVSIDELFPSDS